MEGDPKKLAMLILGKPGGGEKEEESDGDEGAPSGMGPQALKDMHAMMKAGDYSGAFDAFKAAMTCCEDEG